MRSRMKVRVRRARNLQKQTLLRSGRGSPGPLGHSALPATQSAFPRPVPERLTMSAGIVQGKEVIYPFHKGFQPKLLKGCF